MIEAGMKDKLMELAKWCTQPVSEEHAEELSRNDYELGLHQGQKEMGDRILAILDAEEGGYWPDGSDAPIRDYTSAQPARSGVVSEEDVEAAIDVFQDHKLNSLPYRQCMRAALESYERSRK